MTPDHLLLLPLEVRRAIYTKLFQSTTLTYPHFDCPVLATNHQIRNEALPLYFKHATFTFQLVEHFVDYMTSIDRTVLNKLRHMRVKALPFPMYDLEEKRFYTTYGFPNVLKLFPGLELDTLTLDDGYHGENIAEDPWGDGASYREVKELIRSGKGWKKLFFISPNDHFLAGGKPANQPISWDRMIKERDGKESGARVELFQPTKYSKDMTDTLSKTLLGTPTTEIGEEDGVPTETKGVVTSVAITRGRGAEYVEDGIACEDFDQELQTTFRKLTWKELKERGLFIPGAEYDPCAHL